MISLCSRGTIVISQQESRPTNNTHKIMSKQTRNPKKDRKHIYNEALSHLLAKIQKVQGIVRYHLRVDNNYWTSSTAINSCQTRNQCNEGYNKSQKQKCIPLHLTGVNSGSIVGYFLMEPHIYLTSFNIQDQLTHIPTTTWESQSPWSHNVCSIDPWISVQHVQFLLANVEQLQTLWEYPYFIKSGF